MMKELGSQLGESESMRKRSRYISRLEEQRGWESGILPELLENKTVKISCPCGVNVLEREIDNNH